MTGNRLARRLERLEAQIAPTGIQHRIRVRFVDSSGEVTETLVIETDPRAYAQSGHAKRFWRSQTARDAYR